MHLSTLAKRVHFLLLLAFIIFYFYGLGQLPLLGPDEPRYAQVAREMLERRDFITPTLGGHTWFEKPEDYVTLPCTYSVLKLSANNVTGYLFPPKILDNRRWDDLSSEEQTSFLESLSLSEQMYEYMESRIEALKRHIMLLESENEELRRRNSAFVAPRSSDYAHSEMESRTQRV